MYKPINIFCNFAKMKKFIIKILHFALTMYAMDTAVNFKCLMAFLAIKPRIHNNVYFLHQAHNGFAVWKTKSPYERSLLVLTLFWLWIVKVFSHMHTLIAVEILPPL